MSVRKNFYLNDDLEPRLKAYCEKVGLKQAQVFNLAIKSYLDSQDLTNVFLSYKADAVTGFVIDKLKEMNPDFKKKIDEKDFAGL